MKKNQFLRMFVFAICFLGAGMGSISSVRGVDVFQSNNYFCQAIPLLCQTSKNAEDCAGKFPFNTALSLSCKDSTHDADFNGDGYPDCVAGVIRDTGFEHLSVLLNLADQAKDCSEAQSPGSIFNDSQNYVMSSLVGGKDFTNVMTSFESGSIRSEISLISIHPENVNYVSSLLSESELGPNGSTLQSKKIPILKNQSFLPLSHSNQSVIAIECGNSNTSTPVIASIAKDLKTNTFVLNYFKKIDPTNIISINTNIHFNPNADDISETGYLASADFDKDGLLDIVMATSGPENTQKGVGVFLQGNACSFNLKDPFQVALAPIGTVGRLTSLKTGDFNGDQFQDVVLYARAAIAGPPHLIILYGEGHGRFNIPQILNPLDQIALKPNIPQGMAVGCFDNDDKTDILIAGQQTTGPLTAYLLNSTEQFAITNKLNVSTINGSSFTSPTVPFIASIESVNLDRRGGDDVVFVTTDAVGHGKAGIWMNQVENLSASAGPDQNIEVNKPIQLQGDCKDANNTLTPNSYEWIVSNSPQVMIDNPKTFTPTLKVLAEGIFKVTLICHYRCGEVVQDSALLTTTTPIPEEADTIPSSKDLIVEGSGGCSLGDLVTGNGRGGFLLFSILPGLFFSLTRSMRKNKE